MSGIVPNVRRSEKERLIQHLRQCTKATQRTRYLFIVNFLNGHSVAEIVCALHVGQSAVYDVAK